MDLRESSELGSSILGDYRGTCKDFVEKYLFLQARLWANIKVGPTRLLMYKSKASFKRDLTGRTLDNFGNMGTFTFNTARMSYSLNS